MSTFALSPFHLPSPAAPSPSSHALVAPSASQLRVLRTCERTPCLGLREGGARHVRTPTRALHNSHTHTHSFAPQSKLVRACCFPSPVSKPPLSLWFPRRRRRRWAAPLLLLPACHHSHTTTDTSSHSSALSSVCVIALFLALLIASLCFLHRFPFMLNTLLNALDVCQCAIQS